MRSFFRGIFAIILTVAILVAGYWIGILFAVVGFFATALAVAATVIFFVAYAVYDLFKNHRKSR